MEKLIRFELLNETKGAYRYQEIDAEGDPVLEGDAQYVGALYVRKGLASELGVIVDGKPAERIEVTVKAVEPQPASVDELFASK
jgi:hypothetical protein